MTVKKNLEPILERRIFLSRYFSLAISLISSGFGSLSNRDSSFFTAKVSATRVINTKKKTSTDRALCSEKSLFMRVYISEREAKVAVKSSS